VNRTATDPTGGARTATEPRTREATAISLVLPMFNEAEAVDHTLGRAVASLEESYGDFEIVVADDASTDSSAQRVERWVARDPRIRLVRLPRNQRFGGALRAGLAAGIKDFLVYTDFDLPVELSTLPQVLRAFSEADVLTGYAAEEVKHASWKEAVISKGYNLMVRGLFDLKLRDINFGFKALRRQVWDQLSLHSRSPFVDAEMFVLAQRLGYRIQEVPVQFLRRQLGTSHMRRPDVIGWTFLDMVRLRLAPPRRPR
jgi:glycosyltransferase involved in cell wall biosynthesis